MFFFTQNRSRQTNPFVLSIKSQLNFSKGSNSIEHFTALFTNMRIAKFKSQLTIVFFAAVNHLSRPLRKQNFSLMGSKGHGL